MFVCILLVTMKKGTGERNCTEFIIMCNETMVYPSSFPRHVLRHVLGINDEKFDCKDTSLVIWYVIRLLCPYPSSFDSFC